MASRFFALLGFVLAVACCTPATHAATNIFRARLHAAMLSEDLAEQSKSIGELIGTDDPVIQQALVAWRGGSAFLFETNGIKSPVLLDPQPDAEGNVKMLRIEDGEPLKDGAGKPVLVAPTDLTALDADAKLRKVIKETLDLFAIGNPDPKMRRDAVVKLGQEQNASYIPHLERRLKSESVDEVRHAINEAVALIQLASTDSAVRLAAIQRLDAVTAELAKEGANQAARRKSRLSAKLKAKKAVSK